MTRVHSYAVSFSWTCLVVLLSVSTCLAKPLLIRWPAYVSPAPVQRLVLYRGIGTGSLQPYAVLWDTRATSITDNVVEAPKRYCYAMRAFSAANMPSAQTAPTCATPNP